MHRPPFGAVFLDPTMNYMIADTETTGVSDEASACEIGWITIDEDFNILTEVQSIIDPEQVIGAGASAVHGLVWEDCLAYPTIEEFFSVDDPSCYGKKVEEPTVLIGHRISFDRRFLGAYIPNIVQELCTLRWVRNLYPDMDNHQLGTTIFALNLPRSTGAHRVMGDIMSSYHLLKHVAERTGLTLPELAEASAQPMWITRMPFGKHKGEPMADVPRSYLGWMQRSMDLDQDLAHTIKTILNK